MKWLHISDRARHTGGVLTRRFSNSKRCGEPRVVFSGKHVTALLQSQWSFSVHRANVIRFPAHTVSSTVSDISSEGAHCIETVKWVIVTQNIACGCSYQWHPSPCIHACDHECVLREISSVFRNRHTGEIALLYWNVHLRYKFAPPDLK